MSLLPFQTNPQGSHINVFSLPSDSDWIKQIFFLCSWWIFDSTGFLDNFLCHALQAKPCGAQGARIHSIVYYLEQENLDLFKHKGLKSLIKTMWHTRLPRSALNTRAIQLVSCFQCQHCSYHLALKLCKR